MYSGMKVVQSTFQCGFCEVDGTCQGGWQLVVYYTGTNMYHCYEV